MFDKRQGITIIDALQALKPKSEWHLSGDKLKWLDPNQPHPSQTDIDNKIVELQTAYDAQKYARNRKAEYPPWADQLDYIFHNGIDKWKADIVQPIKDKYPKPE